MSRRPPLRQSRNSSRAVRARHLPRRHIPRQRRPLVSASPAASRNHSRQPPWVDHHRLVCGDGSTTRMPQLPMGRVRSATTANSCRRSCRCLIFIGYYSVVRARTKSLPDGSIRLTDDRRGRGVVASSSGSSVPGSARDGQVIQREANGRCSTSYSSSCLSPQVADRSLALRQLASPRTATFCKPGSLLLYMYLLLNLRMHTQSWRSTSTTPYSNAYLTTSY